MLMLSFSLVKAWASGEDDHFVARAEYDFSGNSEEELSFKAGQLIKIAPKGVYLIFNNESLPLL